MRSYLGVSLQVNGRQYSSNGSRGLGSKSMYHLLVINVYFGSMEAEHRTTMGARRMLKTLVRCVDVIHYYATSLEGYTTRTTKTAAWSTAFN